MRLPRPGQPSRGPIGSSTEVTVAQFACVSPAQDSVSWPHKGGPYRGHSCAVRMRLTLSRAAFRGHIGSHTEGHSGAVRMRLPHPGQ
eukprot:8088580-Pyramimonas_sp.AAC.2